MENKHRKRICIVAYALGGGGLERAAALQSIYLSEAGYDIFLVSVLDKIDFNYKGKLLNLGKYKNELKGLTSRLNRFLILKKFLNRNNIDLIIDHRPRTRWFSEWIISTFLYTKPTIYVVQNFRVSNYIPTKNKFLNRPYRNAKKIISVSKAIEKKIKDGYNIKNIDTIYNPVNPEVHQNDDDKKPSKNGDFILWYGRIVDNHKNLKLLIDSYSKSILPEKNVNLIIMGNGSDEEMLKSYALKQRNYQFIKFINFQSKPQYYIKASKFVVLSSRYEGFPLVIPESLACGVPVISTDCKSGPNEIIQHEYNGLLVENENEAALTKALNSFITDKSLYDFCKKNAKGSVDHLLIPNIRDEWVKVIEE